MSVNKTGSNINDITEDGENNQPNALTKNGHAMKSDETVGPNLQSQMDKEHPNYDYGQAMQPTDGQNENTP